MTKGSKHSIKSGGQVNYDRLSDLNREDVKGTFSFASVQSYRNLRPTQFNVDQGDPAIEYGMFRGAWYITDDWKVNGNLTLSFGLRHEFQSYLPDKLNFAPRFGMAWSPFKNRKTVIRAGGGIFFDRLRDNYIESSIRYDGKRVISYRVNNPVYSADVEEAIRLNNLVPLDTEVRRLDLNMKAPYDINTVLSLEQQLPKGFIGTITYLYSKGVDQFRQRNINAPFPDSNNPSNMIFPFPGSGRIMQYEASADSETNRLTFGFNRRISPRLLIFGGYTLSWIMTNGGANPADPYNLAIEWGRADQDRRHNFNTIANMSLPHGFRFQTMISASTGRPFNITLAEDLNNDGIANNDRPLDANGIPIRRNSDLPASLYSLPEFDRLFCGRGQTCRDFLQRNYPNGVKAESPGFFNVNVNLSKTFGFGKSRNQNQLAQGRQGGGERGRSGGGGGGGRGAGGGGPRGGGGGGVRGIGGPGGPGGPGGDVFVQRGGPGGVFFGTGGSETSRLNITFTVGVTNLFNRVNFGDYGGTLGSAFFGIPSSARNARQIDFNVRFNF